MTVRHFHDLESMSHHRREQEPMQAIRVQGMSVAAFSAWLRQALDPLLQLAGPALVFEIDAARARARHFTRRDEKQRFDLHSPGVVMSTERRRAPQPSDVWRLARALREHGVEYAVTGGIAMARQPSRDTDLPDRKRLRQLRDALRAAQAHRPPDSK